MLFRSILSFTPEQKNTWLFSATMPREVRAIMKNYMSDPFELTVGEQAMGNINIEHRYVTVQERDKYLALKRILDFTPDIFGLIFCRTRIDTQRVAEMLIKDGYSADSLHGDLTQQQRDRVMMKFRSRNLQILVATDVAARGIDVEDITHVIHMNMPDEMEFYTHRSGRTARAGKKGISIALVSRNEMGRVKQIEKNIKTPVKRMLVPTGAEVCQKQLLGLMHKVREVKVNEGEIEEFLPAVFEELNDLTKQEIIKRFASIEFNRFLDYYRNAPDLNADQKRTEGATERYATGARFFINLGKMDGLDKAKLLELIDESTGLGQRDIGKIDLKGAYSFFEVEKEMADKVTQGFKGIEYQTRQVRVEITDSKSSDSPRSSSRRDEEPQARRPFGDKKPGEKKFGDKKFGDKKFGDKKFGDKKRGGFNKKWR